MSNAQSGDTLPVLIVGGGPVGMTLASELARYGIDVRIVDKAAHRADTSRALVLWSRTLELLDRGFGAAPFVEVGLQTKHVSILNGDTRIGRIDMSGVASPYPYALMIPQSETERLLEAQLEKQGIAVERRVEVTAIQAVDGGVRAVLRAEDGSEETVQAKWLVGCDGAHSVVRHSLGVSFAGETLPSDWVLGDVHVSGYPYGTDVSVYWHREGVLVIFPISEGRYRVLADVASSAAEQPPAPTVDQLQALLDQRGSQGMTIGDPVWLAGFRINDRKVAEYRHGRVFLAGDAAHIHSPAGGQGMNTGMQDAFNLAWKLALVIEGTGSEDLLDSYSPERSYVGEEVLKGAGRLTKVATLRNPVAQHIRNFAAHAVLGLPSVQHAASEMVTEIAIHYPDSPLNGPALSGGPRPGARVAPVAGQLPAGSGAAPLFALHADNTPEIASLVAAFEKLVSPDIRPPLAEGGIWLVRPDGYVACAAEDTGPIVAYLKRIAR
jgi:2-polyprenyl-6-methoxyphenol hydroxylase-like FAD-dependent oxidoreductase